MSAQVNCPKYIAGELKKFKSFKRVAKFYPELNSEFDKRTKCFIDCNFTLTHLL